MYHGHLQLKRIGKNMGWKLYSLIWQCAIVFFFFLIRILAAFIVQCLDDKRVLSYRKVTHGSCIL